MAKHPVNRSKEGALESEVLAHIAELLREAGFSTKVTDGVGDGGIDAVAERMELGRPRQYVIQLKTRSEVSLDLTRQAVGIMEHERNFHEFWLIAPSFSRTAMKFVQEYPRVRLFTLAELEEMLAGSRET